MDKIVVNGFSIEHARAQFDRLKTADQTRGELLDQLIREVERLTQKYDDVESRLEREQTTSSTYHQRSRDLQLELDKTGREMVHLQTRNAFVLVLIDGDGVNFKDTVLHSGGNTAANQLRKSTQEYVSQMRPDVPDFEIIIRIYVNLKGLARTYRDLEQPADFEQFVQEFNMAHPLGEIINAGHGKECADEKIKSMFVHHLQDIHCKHIIFGGSADNSYGTMLRPHTTDESIRQRITLLKGPPFARELSELLPHFHETSFPELFRDSKLPTRRVSFSTTPPRSPVARPISYATTAAAAISATSVASSPPAPSNDAVRPPFPAIIYRNQHGQRVDKPLQHSAKLVNHLKSLKLCNRHHLLETCEWDDCTHKHGPRVQGKEYVAVRALARLSPCSAGLDCDDEYCIAGHKCPSSSCPRINCRFTNMHGIDQNIVSEQ